MKNSIGGIIIKYTIVYIAIQLLNTRKEWFCWKIWNFRYRSEK